MQSVEQLSPFWESSHPIFPLHASSEFGKAGVAIFDEEIALAAETGQTGFEPEVQLRIAKRVAALRIRTALEVFGVSQAGLAKLLDTRPETICRVLALETAPSYQMERRLFRELIVVAVFAWVDSWIDEDAKNAFCDVYRANPLDVGAFTIEGDDDAEDTAEYSDNLVRTPPDKSPTYVSGEPIADRFARAVFALGAVCGADGWRDFWTEIGCHLAPIPAHQASAEFFAHQVAEGKRRAQRGDAA